jgi:neutral trehalase
MKETVKNVITNIGLTELDMVEKFGFFPNAARIYYLNRSQEELGGRKAERVKEGRGGRREQEGRKEGGGGEDGRREGEGRRRKEWLTELDMVEKFGFFPNGARIYYLNRSQPPLLSEMVQDYFGTTGDFQFLERAVEVLDRVISS